MIRAILQLLASLWLLSRWLDHPYAAFWLVVAGTAPLLYTLAEDDLAQEACECSYAGLVLLAAWHFPIFILGLVPWALEREQGRVLGTVLSVPLFPLLVLLVSLRRLALRERAWLDRRRAVWAGLIGLGCLACAHPLPGLLLAALASYHGEEQEWLRLGRAARLTFAISWLVRGWWEVLPYPWLAHCLLLLLPVLLADTRARVEWAKESLRSGCAPHPWQLMQFREMPWLNGELAVWILVAGLTGSVGALFSLGVALFAQRMALAAAHGAPRPRLGRLDRRCQALTIVGLAWLGPLPALLAAPALGGLGRVAWVAACAAHPLGWTLWAPAVVVLKGLALLTLGLARSHETLAWAVLVFCFPGVWSVGGLLLVLLASRSPRRQRGRLIPVALPLR